MFCRELIARLARCFASSVLTSVVWLFWAKVADSVWGLRVRTVVQRVSRARVVVEARGTPAKRTGLRRAGASATETKPG